MKLFLSNLKRSAEENPLLAIGLGVSLTLASSRLIEAVSHAVSRGAYARQTTHRVKNT